MAYTIDPFAELERFLPKRTGVHHPDAVQSGDSPLSSRTEGPPRRRRLLNLGKEH